MGTETPNRMIYALDPGLMSGVCVLELPRGQDPIIRWTAEQEVDDVIPTLRSILAAYPHLEVVCERFVITPQTAKKSPQGWSLEIIGSVKQTMRDVGKTADDIYFQKPADAMNLFPNVGLKKLGYWHKGGKDHANDAIRHALLYISDNGWMPVGLIG